MKTYTTIRIDRKLREELRLIDSKSCDTAIKKLISEGKNHENNKKRNKKSN